MLRPVIVVPVNLKVMTVGYKALVVPSKALKGLFLSPVLSSASTLVGAVRVSFLRPMCALAFDGKLVTYFMFVKVNALLSIKFLLRGPFTDVFLTLYTRLNAFLAIPVTSNLKLSLGRDTSITVMNKTSNPVILFASLTLTGRLFMPVAIITCLCLKLACKKCPCLIGLLVPGHLHTVGVMRGGTPGGCSTGIGLTFSTVLYTMLYFLFPITSPLFFSLFLKITMHRSNVGRVCSFIDNPLLCNSAFVLKLLLNMLYSTRLLLSPGVLGLLMLNVLTLLLSNVKNVVKKCVVCFVGGKGCGPIVNVTTMDYMPAATGITRGLMDGSGPGSFVLNSTLKTGVSKMVASTVVANVCVAVVPCLWVVRLIAEWF